VGRVMTRPWSALRIAVLIAAAIGTLFWIGSVVSWWNIPASRRDGLELIGPVVATLFFAGLVLPTLVLGLLGRWLVVAAILGAAVLVLASDTLFPWLPWGRLPGPPSWL
jgi:hypothetical protein